VDPNKLEPEDHIAISGLAKEIIKLVNTLHRNADTQLPVIEKLCVYHTGDSEEVIIRHGNAVFRVRIDVQDVGYRFFDQIEEALKAEVITGDSKT